MPRPASHDGAWLQRCASFRLALIRERAEDLAAERAVHAWVGGKLS